MERGYTTRVEGAGAGARRQLRVRPGQRIVDPETGSVVFNSGDEVPLDHPLAAANRSRCYVVEVADVPAGSRASRKKDSRETKPAEESAGPAEETGEE